MTGTSISGRRFESSRAHHIFQSVRFLADWSSQKMSSKCRARYMLSTQSSRSHVGKIWFLTGSYRPEADTRHHSNLLISQTICAKFMIMSAIYLAGT